MEAYLDLDAGLTERLWSHLLQDDNEQVAVVFASTSLCEGAIIFDGEDLFLAGPPDFAIQSEFHVELADDARSRIIKRAWDSATTPVEFHSHPSDVRGANFSWSDMRGFADYVPHCRWRLRNRPYLALVVSPGGMDALAWVDASPRPIPLKAIREGGLVIRTPTNQTIQDLGQPSVGASSDGQ